MMVIISIFSMFLSLSVIISHLLACLFVFLSPAMNSGESVGPGEVMSHHYTGIRRTERKVTTSAVHSPDYVICME